MRRRVALFALFLLLANSSFGQIQLPKKLPRIPVDKIPGLDRIPGLDKILGKDPPITTGLSDALTEVEFLDEFTPVFPRVLPEPESDGQILITPGAYSYESMSYCLHAGTYAPGRGAGYLYAPLKGPKAEIISTILRRSAAHPEIPQTEIQVLVWAILSRTKLSDMAPNRQLTASKLLTPKELFDLNGGALGLIPEDVKQRALANVPDSVRRVIEAEAKLRQMLTQTNARFEDLERAAVLFGAPPPEPGDRTDLPAKRWSWHPNGYFVRFDAQTYRLTTVDLYLPERFDVARDDQGRIVRIADPRGNRVEVTYAPSRQRVAATSFRASPFASVRLIRSVGGEESTVASWQNTGWTLGGVPGESSQVAGETMAMTGIASRVTTSRRRAGEFDRLLRQLSKRLQSRSNRAALVAELIDFAHLHDGIAALAGDRAEKDREVRASLNLILMAWQAALQNEVSPRVRQVASMMVDPGHDGWTYDPSDTVAQPGQAGRQRLAQSPRKDCDDGDTCQKLGAALQSVTKGIQPKRDKGIAAVKAPFKSNLEKALKDVEKSSCSDDSLKSAMGDLLKEVAKVDETPANTAEVVANNAILKGVEDALRRIVEAKCAVSPPANQPCPVQPLPALSEDAQEEEDGANGESRLNQDMQDALQCLRDDWTEAGNGNVTVSSSFRSTEYQRHLYQLWMKYVELLRSRNPACDELREQIEAEMKRHGVIGKPLNPDSATASQAQHPQGAAIDVGIPQNEEEFLAAARCCNLYRPWGDNDPVHFEVCPADMNCTAGCEEAGEGEEAEEGEEGEGEPDA